MQTTIICQVLYLLFLTGLSTGKKEAELKVKTEYKPEDCSELADNGDQVSVHYTGYLETGTIFDSSVKAGRDPLVFMLGEGRVIPGWEMGIKGMCVGEKRKLIIPPHLAYGQAGFPPTIPEEATLIFETELVHLEKKPFHFDLVGSLQMLSIPALVAYIIYFLYDRYKKETSEAKELKKSKKRK
ncbi:uncharacterized protein LOC143277257 [Babylonia areolata]|uniref:uncharacterized protein LOC143277257 n=1 Tax=Babylonia areolata TaxID=304850 RepID=UPI003FD3E0EC